MGRCHARPGRGGIVPLRLREDEHAEKKERIAREAAALVRDGDTVILDASSTVRRMLPYLTERRDLRLITNNRRIFEAELPGSFRLFCTGGSYNRENHDFCGAAAEAYLRAVRADVVFFSSQGLNAARRHQRRIGGGDLAAAGDAVRFRPENFSVRFLQARRHPSVRPL